MSPPLPSGGLRRLSSQMDLMSSSNLRSMASPMSNAKPTSTSPSNIVHAPSDGSAAKYAFLSRAQTSSSTSSASGTSHTLADAAGSPPQPLQLPWQAVSARPTGDRTAVHVPFIPAALTLSLSTLRWALRTPSLSSARFASAGYNSDPSSPCFLSHSPPCWIGHLLYSISICTYVHYKLYLACTLSPKSNSSHPPSTTSAMVDSNAQKKNATGRHADGGASPYLTTSPSECTAPRWLDS